MGDRNRQVRSNWKREVETSFRKWKHREMEMRRQRPMEETEMGKKGRLC